MALLKLKKRYLIIIAVALVAVTVGIRIVSRRLSGAGAHPSSVEYPVRGIDVSAHNGDIDFERVAASGEVDFVMLKATEGTNFKDSRFVDNYRKAVRAGLKVGVYHFFRFDTDSELQAINLLHSLRNRRVDFPVVIDIEEWGNPDGLATSKIVASLRSVIEIVESAGYPVMLYTNKDGYQRFIKGNFDDYPLWICSFTDLPVDCLWMMWQYSHRGRVDGIDGNVDLDVFASDTIPSMLSAPAQ